MSTERYETAARRVDQLVGLTAHVLAFVTVNAVLFAPAGFDPEAGHFWGWGVGVAAHALAVLGPGSRIRQRLIQRRLRRTPGQLQ